MLRTLGVMSLLIVVAGGQPAAFSNVTGPIPDCRVEDRVRPDAGVLPAPSSLQEIPCSNTVTNCAGNWGLDRLDAPDGLDGFYIWNLDGTGVHIYILDEGFAVDHPEFADRVDCTLDFSSGSSNPSCGGSVHDATGYGHGTHVTAIAAGKTYGVARNASLTLIKLGGNSYEQSLANALLWVAAEVQQHRGLGESWPAVVNLSGANRRNLRHDSTLHAAIRTLRASGALLVQAAGNQEQNACDWSFGHPYGVPGVLVMGGLDRSDAPFHDNEDPALVVEPGTNFGRCVDLWSPASQIRSAAPELYSKGGVSPEPSSNTFCRLTGTSMAAPFATGVAALLLQHYPQASGEEVETAIRALAVGGRVQLSPHAGELPSPNRLLQSRVPQSSPTALPPSAGDDFFQTNGAPVSVRFADLTRNDWDWDGSSLTVIAVTPPASGTFTTDATGFTYSPAADGRNVAFEYRVRNGLGMEATGRITILNSRPVAVDDQILFTGSATNPIFLKQLPSFNDFDPDGVDGFATSVIPAQLTVIVPPEQPAKGSVARVPTSSDDNPSYIYTAGPAFDGKDSFRYRVRDAEGNESWETIHVRQVTQVASTTTISDRFELAQDQEVLIDVIGRKDADGNSDSEFASWTLVDVTPPSHGSASVVGGWVRYAPVPGYAGFDSFTYRVRNESGADATASVTLEIVPVPGGSQVPRAEDDFLSTPRNTNLVIGYAGLLANDAGDNLSVNASIAAPQHGTVDLCCSGQAFTYIPDHDFFGGRDWFNYRLVDGSGAVDIGTVWVDVTFANRGPVAGADSAVTEHNTPVTLAVLANDSDPDGDALTVVGVTQPASGGTVTFTSSSVTFTPTPGFAGTVPFTYIVRDSFGATTNGPVSVRVRAANVAPVAVDNSFSMFRNGTLVFTCAQLLANDMDSDAEPALGDQLTVTSVGPPTSGTLTCASCSCTFRPATGSVAAVNIPYSITDARPGGTASAFARITVVNRAPVANADVASTPPGTPVTIAVRANDSDPDGDPITVRDITAQAASGTGTCTVAAGGTGVVYTPPAGFLGQTSCAYRVADDLLATSSPATITIYINKSPLARGDQLRIPYGLQTQISRATLLANDYDPDGNPLTIASFATAGMGGTLSCPAGSGFCTYMPPPGFTGVTSFNYTATDGRNGFSTATVKLKVGVVQSMPVANDDLFTTTVNTPLPFTILNVCAKTSLALLAG